MNQIVDAATQKRGKKKRAGRVYKLPDGGKKARGDTDPDGFVFWAVRSDSGMELWATPEEFELLRLSAKKALLKPHPPKRYAQGFVREDGMVFWVRNKRCKNGEQWVTPEQFARKKAEGRIACRKSALKHPAPPKIHKAGDVREDGMIYAFRKPGRNGHVWMTPEQYRSYRGMANAVNRKIWANNMLHRQAHKWRGYLRLAIQQGKKRNSHVRKDLIGCTDAAFRHHIETLFKEGMTWDNRAEWHLDHITPCTTARTLDDLKQLFHYTNIQPLWAEENRAKGVKIPEAP